MYYDMSKFLQPMTLGSYELEHFTINNIDDSIRLGIPLNKTFVRLIDNSLKVNKCVMSNTPMEEYTNREFVLNAFGDVLIGGLGIGLIIMSLQDKENVNSITVVEKSKDIIDMITSQLKFNNKVTIINDDVFTYKPGNKAYDCIYMDVWNYINSDIYNDEMLPLINKYEKYLKSKEDTSNGFISCWAERQAKNDERLW